LVRLSTNINSQEVFPFNVFCTLSPTTASSDDCSQSCMLPRGRSPASDATSTSHRHCVTFSTGCRYHSASPSKLSWWRSTVLAADVRSTLVMCTLLYTPLLLVCDCDHPTMVTSSSHAHSPLGLAAAVSACADQQFGTNFHRICEAQTLGNSLNVVTLNSWLFECSYRKK